MLRRLVDTRREYSLALARFVALVPPALEFCSTVSRLGTSSCRRF